MSSYETSFPVRADLTLKDKIKAHIELLDPVTWISAVQGLLCGAIASGEMQLSFEHVGLLVALIMLYGPLGTGFSQSINDYYDRFLDKVNEPTRPIPSGRISEKEAVWNWVIVGILSVSLGVWLGLQFEGERRFVIIASIIVGLIMGYIYSAPPFKLKRNVLTSAPAVGISYSLITWLSGNALYADIRIEVVYMALINALMTIGLIFLNDFKSVEGDRAGGLKSLPVMIGPRNTYVVSFFFVDLPFIWFIYLMHQWGFTFMFYFSAVSLVIIFVMQMVLYFDPKDGAKALDASVKGMGFESFVGKSDVKEHKSFLRYLIVNNGLYLINVFAASYMLSTY
ncbi:bacteriochlorophyll/chlorophyll synthetase [Chloroherpeton thalassium ATCC 35110]|uniref:Bacteriochlorophyll/chlorophyll synthetase n=1 Tax=Chloroherpeton thalassium (strain ATCC 35110 / GB-78) TaxID=517418 RepID=B3QV99_CHLT3|nr:(bacterio)chlorophyll synthase [Chloroherpeton thalassium]ACF13053.1 bacteriochlorophyll/chlorophyll synthetase [Chloroherpeton thalassium ATCC 35110]